MLTGTTALAPGVYPVADTYATNTVSAGSVDGYIYGSFAGFITSDNKISIPLWLINQGTATVLENGVIEVNAQNTKGASILVRLGEYPEGIENTKGTDKVTKRLENGQLIIIKNGVKYNATGIILL